MVGIGSVGNVLVLEPICDGLTVGEVVIGGANRHPDIRSISSVKSKLMHESFLNTENLSPTI